MGWWSEQARKSSERKEQTRKPAELNEMVERRNRIDRHVWGHVLGLGRPLTRSEATSVWAYDDLEMQWRHDQFLKEAAARGDANAKWMIENSKPVMGDWSDDAPDQPGD